MTSANKEDYERATLPSSFQIEIGPRHVEQHSTVESRYYFVQALAFERLPRIQNSSWSRVARDHAGVIEMISKKNGRFYGRNIFRPQTNLTEFRPPLLTTRHLSHSPTREDVCERRFTDNSPALANRRKSRYLFICNEHTRLMTKMAGWLRTCDLTSIARLDSTCAHTCVHTHTHARTHTRAHIHTCVYTYTRARVRESHAKAPIGTRKNELADRRRRDGETRERSDRDRSSWCNVRLAGDAT